MFEIMITFWLKLEIYANYTLLAHLSLSNPDAKNVALQLLEEICWEWIIQKPDKKECAHVQAMILLQFTEILRLVLRGLKINIHCTLYCNKHETCTVIIS